MNEGTDTPQRIAALLAWYRDMGVTAIVQDAPEDWTSRGDRAPGAGFDMPIARGGAAPSARGPAGVAAKGGTTRREPLPAGLRPAGPPSPSAPLSRPLERQPANVRSFDKPVSATPAAAPVRVEAGTLAALGEALAAFDGGGLKATAKSLCLFRGAEKGRVMMIGDAPGRDEDLAGQPFMGPPGQLLDRMLAAIALTAEDIHLTNLVYWRPPGNRKPFAHEIAACAPFLMRQIELVGPQVVVLLGEASARQMLGTTEGIMKLRGKWREIEVGGKKIKAIATLDPAYVLKAAASKRQVWRDLLAIKTELSGLETHGPKAK